jgi:hypothetical protein
VQRLPLADVFLALQVTVSNGGFSARTQGILLKGQRLGQGPQGWGQLELLVGPLGVESGQETETIAVDAQHGPCSGWRTFSLDRAAGSI